MKQEVDEPIERGGRRTTLNPHRGGIDQDPKAVRKVRQTADERISALGTGTQKEARFMNESLEQVIERLLQTDADYQAFVRTTKSYQLAIEGVRR